MATLVSTRANSLSSGRLPRMAPWGILLACWVVMAVVFGLLMLGGSTTGFDAVGAIFWGTVLYVAAIWGISRLVEGQRKATDRLVTALVVTAFIVALLPLVSLVATVLGAVTTSGVQTPGATP